MNSTSFQIAAIFQRVYEGNSLPSDWETYVRLTAKIGGHTELNESNYVLGSKKHALQMYAIQVLKMGVGTWEMKRLAEMYLRDNANYN